MSESRESKSARNRAYREANKVAIAEYSKAYAETHASTIAARRKAYREANKESISAYSSAYRKKHRTERSAYARHRRATDANFKLAYLLRIRISKALKGGSKSGSAISDLGCSVEFLKHYLEERFQPGMTWNNHGEWHVDHSKPLSHFDLKDRAQFLQACHYTNLQPMWAKDNLRKSDRLI